LTIEKHVAAIQLNHQSEIINLKSQYPVWESNPTLAV